MKSLKINQAHNTVEQQAKEKVLNFNVDFSALPLNRYMMPQSIDQYWNKIGCKESFKSVFLQLQKPLSPDVFNRLFKIGENPTPFLNSFWDIISHMKFILPPLDLVTFISHPKLEMDNLYKLIPHDSRVLLISSICLINSVIKNRDYKTQNKIVYEFAKLLVPSQESLFQAEKIEIPVAMFAPAVLKDINEKIWIVLKKDMSISVYKNAEGSSLLHEIPPNSYQFDVKQGSLTTTTHTFLFTTQNGPDIFDAASKDPNSFIPFIQSFQGNERGGFLNTIPMIVKKQIIVALGSPDFILAKSVVQALVDDKSDQNNYIFIFTALNETGTFAPFIRQAFMDDVLRIDDPAKLFRTETIATRAATTIMGSSGAHLILQIKRLIANFAFNPAQAMRSIIQACSYQMPLLMNFIFSCAFKSTRRKFSNNLLPVVAASSIFILRYLNPQLINEPALKDCGSHLAKGFLLRRDDPTVNDEKLMRETCQFLIDLTKLNGSAFQFPPYDFGNIIKFLSVANEKIINNYKKQLQIQNTDPPLTWSVVEMIENCFVSDNDYTAEILGADLFDSETISAQNLDSQSLSSPPRASTVIMPQQPQQLQQPPQLQPLQQPPQLQPLQQPQQLQPLQQPQQQILSPLLPQPNTQLPQFQQTITPPNQINSQRLTSFQPQPTQQQPSTPPKQLSPQQLAPFQQLATQQQSAPAPQKLNPQRLAPFQ